MPTSPLLESCHPHLSKKISMLWGSIECRNAMLTLIIDTRDGKRQGFDKPVASEIIQALKAHDEQFPWFDTSDTPDIPFKGLSPIRRQVAFNDFDGLKVVIGFTAKVVAAILIAVFFFKLFK